MIKCEVKYTAFQHRIPTHQPATTPSPPSPLPAPTSASPVSSSPTPTSVSPGASYPVVPVPEDYPAVSFTLGTCKPPFFTCLHNQHFGLFHLHSAFTIATITITTTGLVLGILGPGAQLSGAQLSGAQLSGAQNA